MNWFQGMLKKVFISKSQLGYEVSSQMPPQPEAMLPGTGTNGEMPPGESSGRHFMQRSSRPHEDHSRLPLEQQNAIFFSGQNK